MSQFRNKKIADALYIQDMLTDALFIVGYKQVDANLMHNIRQEAKSRDITIKAVKNNVLRKALNNTEFTALQDTLVEQNLVFIPKAEKANECAQLLKESSVKFQVKSIMVEGVIYSGSDLATVASLPNRMQALVMLSQALISPLSGLREELSKPVHALVNALTALTKQKGESNNE